MNKFVQSSFSAYLNVFINCAMILLGTGFNWYGTVFILIGGYIYLYNRYVMKKVWSAKVESKKTLVTDGWFKYIRHPLYFGLLVMYAGFIITTLNLYLLVFFVFVNMPYWVYRAILEEKLLSKNLKGYKQYMERTEMFFPRIEFKL